MSKELITLSVGGQIFTTYPDVLRGSTFFDLYLSGQWKKEKKTTVKGVADIVLDRDAYLFGHILNFLRGCNYLLPKECVPELLYLGIPFEDKDIDYRIEQLTEEIKKIRLNQQKKCLLCNKPIRHSYNTCPEHKNFPGWPEKYKVIVRGKGWVPSKSVKIGDYVRIHRTTGYAIVTKIYKKSDAAVRESKTSNSKFSDGLLFYTKDNIERWDAEKRVSESDYKNIINFELDRCHLVHVKTKDEFHYFIKTF